MSRLRRRGGRALDLALVALLALLVTACSGIPDSGPVHDVRQATDQGNQQAPLTPDAGMTPDAIVRGFVYAAARITLAGPTSAYAAPRQYLTAKAAQTWQGSKPSSVVILPDQFRVDVGSADPATLTISAPILGSLDVDHVYHPSTGATYRVTVHVVKEVGQWRISDPPAELLIRDTDFASVFSVRTLYFLDAGHSVVVPDRRYLITGGPPASRVVTLMNLLLHGPAGVLTGAAQSELNGAALRTYPVVDADGVTVVDLKGIDLPTNTDRNALAAQIVWTLSPDAGQVAININGAPLDPQQPIYRASTVASFSADRVPGKGVVASDPYFLNSAGGIVDLLTKRALFGGVGTGSQHVVSAAMSAATGTLAAVSDVGNLDGTASQQLLIGQPLAYQQSVPALKATTLTQPSFSRSGDEVWVVQNGATKNPEIYQVSTSRTSTTGGDATGGGTASRAKVGSAELTGKGSVSALVLSPDGVRVAIVAGGRLYLGAVAAAAADSKSGSSGASAAEGPDAVTVTNLRELRPDLQGVGAVAFQSANELMVVADNRPYRSIQVLNIDGSELTPVTTDSQNGDVVSLAVSVVDSAAGPGGDSASVAGIYVTLGVAGTLGPVLKLQGALADGRWVPADSTSPEATGVFFPN